METASIAKVAVSAAPYSIDKPYDYLIPAPLADQAVPGVRVTIPFGRGNRTSEGIILAVGIGEKTPSLKPLASVLDGEPVLDREGIQLALWMRSRYFCTLFEAVKTILPAGLWYHLQEIWSLTGAAPEHPVSGGEAVLEALTAADGSASLETLRELCGEEATSTLHALQKAGAVTCAASVHRQVSDKTRRMVELALSAEEALAIVESGRRASPVRREVVHLLASAGRTSAAEVSYFTGASMQSLRSMEKAGLITFSQEEELRISQPEEPVEPGAPIVLSREQEEAFQTILALTGTGRPEAVLLQGVTGSGKTQVYLRLVQEVLAQGKTAMVLVPEIVLTPQMMRKFSSYFGQDVAMLHSGLRMTERYDQWKRIRRGEARVVLGTRSAVFAPLQDLGLIVLDEEQEGSYQSENPPRYHTRDVAKYRCGRSGAVLVLGSATPSVETAWAARQGTYHLAELKSRYNRHALPQVIVSDMRQEIRNGNAGLIGGELRRELEANLERGEQSILFLNRRGNSRMLLCGECGHVPECPRCSVALTYHSANGRLMCHHCGHSERAPDRCPVCGGFMKHVGAGTQKVEEELRELFPDTEILRMDADTTAGGHGPILRRFQQERIPILLGTQMVAKGLDFENVTLVGVLSADLSLYVESFRASERTFSLLTQVVGRAGRGDKLGRAVIQTYTPENDVIQCAARQDYERFYESEIRLRQVRRCPPFADWFLFTLSGTEEGSVLRAAAAVREALRQLWGDDPETEVLGPAPAPVLKVNNRYRYRCQLVRRNDRFTRERVDSVLRWFAGGRQFRGVNLFVDCNPME